MTDPDRLSELLQTHCIETFCSETILIERHVDGNHGDIWEIRKYDLQKLVRSKLVHRRSAPSHARQVFGLGSVSIRELRGSVRRLLRPPELQSPPAPSEASPSRIGGYQRNTGNLVALVPARKNLQKPPASREGHSAIVGHDDQGNPITELEVTREGNRAVPRNMPVNLIPDAPEGCSDKEWERLMLIEQIRFRRRMDAKRATG
ncbi:hypothetical protein GOB57_21780 [Sinorhizobium meliloti]|nr:hypothetical protein [Sinorhizobium meliloti]